MDERLMKAKVEAQLAIEIGMEWKKLAQAAEARAEKYREALEIADREASIAHDAIWSPEVCGEIGTGFGILHDNDREDSAQSAIWRLHEAVRPHLPDPRQERDAGAEG